MTLVLILKSLGKCHIPFHYIWRPVYKVTLATNVAATFYKTLLKKLT